MEGWAADIANTRKRQEALEKKLLQAQLIRRLPGLSLLLQQVSALNRRNLLLHLNFPRSCPSKILKLFPVAVNSKILILYRCYADYTALQLEKVSRVKRPPQLCQFLLQ